MKDIKKGKHRGWLKFSQDHFGEPLKIPYMTIKGCKSGPNYVFTSGIHGDELNGISVIHNLFNKISPKSLKGNIYFFPVLNLPGNYKNSRLFSDNVDLNHIMGGGNTKLPSHYYQEELLPLITSSADVVFDLHSERKHLKSSCFAIADLSNKTIKKYVSMMNLDYVFNSKPSLKTFRGYCASKNIPCICYEIGSANKHQNEIANSITQEFLNIFNNNARNNISCSKSTWQMSRYGGYTTLNIFLNQNVKKGDLIGYCSDIFGRKIADFYAEKTGRIVGYNEFPFINKGDKLIHIGTLDEK